MKSKNVTQVRTKACVYQGSHQQFLSTATCSNKPPKNAALTSFCQQARTEQSEMSHIFLQLSTYKALKLSHNQTTPKKHKPKRNPNKLTHKEIKIWLYEIAAIIFQWSTKPEH